MDRKEPLRHEGGCHQAQRVRRGVRAAGAALVAMGAAGVLPARADVALDAHHSPVALDVVDGSAVLTVDLTLRNIGDESLADVTLQPMGVVYPSPDGDSIRISNLPPGADALVRWTLHSSQTQQLEQLGSTIGIRALATTTTGTSLTLSLSSQGE